jgi:hypothetical protein
MNYMSTNKIYDGKTNIGVIDRCDAMSEELEVLKFPDRNNTLVPTERSLAFDRKEAEKTIRVTPKTSIELGESCIPTLHQFMPAWDIQAYARFAKIRLHIHNSHYPEYEATGIMILIFKCIHVYHLSIEQNNT